MLKRQKEIKKSKEKEHLVKHLYSNSDYDPPEKEIKKYLDDGWIVDRIVPQPMAGGDYRTYGNYLCIFYKYVEK